VDTWEPFPSGPSTFELYVQRYGQEAPLDSLRGYRVFGGPSWGLTPKVHASLCTGLTSSDLHLGGIDFLALGLFYGLFDGKVFDFDAYGLLSAFGEGLGLSSRLGGLEANLDFQYWGAFARAAWSWENDGADAEGEAVIGRRGCFTYGAYVEPSPRAQFLAELVQEDMRGFESRPDDFRNTSWAVGYNRQITSQVELIFEGRAHEPVSGEKRIWDFTLGAVTIW
jgi:hypothetical protein